jgi:transposase
VQDAPRSGRPRVLNEDDKDKIENAMKDKWGVSLRGTVKWLNCLPETVERNIKFTVGTVRNFVKGTEWGKIAYRKRKTFMLSNRNIADRVAFCNGVIASGYCGEDEMGHIKRNNILFTDESWIELFPTPNSQNTRIRTLDASLRTASVIPKHGLKILVAGGMTAHGLTTLHVCNPGVTVNGEYYRSHILPVYLDAINQPNIFSRPSEATFMQDGAPAHSAVASLSRIREVYRQCWVKGDWPGGSPDLNPIEHIWAILKDAIFSEPRPRNRPELVFRTQMTWNSISNETLQALSDSFRNRIFECVNKYGRQTGY